MIAKHLLLMGCFCSLAAPALAWDPNTDAQPTEFYHAPRLPNHVVPARYYRAPTPPPTPSVTPAPTYYSAPEVYPSPEETVATSPLPAPPTYPEYTPPTMNAPATTALSERQKYQFYLGMEAFYDRYREPEWFPDLETTAYYGGVDAGLTRYWNRDLYTTLEARISHGREDYKSNSGEISGIPQWESDVRLLGGYDFAAKNGDHFKYFLGLGNRYYIDDSKGEVTNLGLNAYERRVFQLYMPVGMTYEFQAYGLTMAPTVEYDQLIYGYVSSRLQNIPGYEELKNIQTDGYGIRGDFMVSSLDARGRGWQAGPFVRYWNVKDSKEDNNGPLTALGQVGWEPKNTRHQVGAKVRYLF